MVVTWFEHIKFVSEHSYYEINKLINIGAKNKTYQTWNIRPWEMLIKMKLMSFP